MKNLTQYLEEVQINSGIRRIEIALSTLYNINDLLIQIREDPDRSIETKSREDKNALKRQFSYIRDNLLSAASFFNIQEYSGKIIKGKIAEVVDSSIVLLNELLSDYNDGVDDHITWGKTSMDIASTMTEVARKI